MLTLPIKPQVESQAHGITEKNYASGDLNSWVWARGSQLLCYPEGSRRARLSPSCMQLGNQGDRKPYGAEDEWLE